MISRSKIFGLQGELISIIKWVVLVQSMKSDKMINAAPALICIYILLFLPDRTIVLSNKKSVIIKIETNRFNLNFFKVHLGWFN